ncbi:MAG: quinate 5-dehydrogenase, partial [Coriobacteriia bacterium]|nr:quinate 5-dehydrogenase [Coriobacteriia bacterium]
MELVKEVVSVSIGSSTRDHVVEIELLGEQFRISRVGTDGDLDRAAAKFAELKDKVDAFGMGGIDMYLRAAGRKYYFREAKKLRKAAGDTPIVDGSGLKGAVEANVPGYLTGELGLELRGKRVLMTSAVDRWGMAEGLRDAGCEMVFGDLIYALGIPFPIRSWGSLVAFVRTLTPVVSQLPFSWLYPTGSEQNKEPKPNPRMEKIYRWADIIAGDFQYVRKYMPDGMEGKWVITNTTTTADVEEMRAKGIELLVTSTPRLDGRSFGTNVIEATMVALKGAPGELAAEEYMTLLREVGFA